MSEVQAIRDQLVTTFAGHRTRNIQFRIAQLQSLQRFLRDYRDLIASALHRDLHKPPFDAHGEVLACLTEVDYVTQRLEEWMKPVQTPLPLTLAPASSFIQHEPLGTCLIIGPFNFPIVLTIMPLIGTIAAGNCAVIKPSELVPETESIFLKYLPKYLDPNCFRVVTGDASIVTQLLALRWDKIFFTGSTHVGKIVMRAAAEHLTPVTLELGGKSPVLIDSNCGDLNVIAKRIVWGKMTNCGQICVAPDYIFCHNKHYDTLLQLLKHYTTQFYSENPEGSSDLAHLVNDRHFERVQGMLEKSRANIYSGGRVYPQQRLIELTVLTNVPADAPVMQEEIFGPLLPVYKYDSDEEIISFVRQREKPLALYLFSSNNTWIKNMLQNIQSGTTLVNDVILMVANREAPFGGVGQSGMGRYFGKYSFECFSHARPVLHRDISVFFDDLMPRYPPHLDFEKMLKGMEMVSKCPNIPPWRDVVQYARIMTFGAILALLVEHYPRLWQTVTGGIFGAGTIL